MHYAFKLKDPVKVRKIVDTYFSSVEKRARNGEAISPTIESLCLELGINKSKYSEYIKKARERDDEELKAVAEELIRGKQLCEAYLTNYLLNGRHTAGCIFTLKNNYKWIDKVEQVNTIKDSQVDDLSEDELRKKLEELDGK